MFIRISLALILKSVQPFPAKIGTTIKNVGYLTVEKQSLNVSETYHNIYYFSVTYTSKMK